MNCKPGDLAVIVSGERNVGRFCNVLAESDFHGYGWWYVEIVGRPAPGLHPETGRPGFGTEGNIEDRRLRPIRPDDVTDEEVRDLYAPKQPEHA